MPEAEAAHIYANGAALLLCADGTGTTVYIDADRDGVRDAGERSLFEAGVPGAPENGADLSGWSIFGGAHGRGLAGDTLLTLRGGRVAALYGGGGGRKARISGDTHISVLFGAVSGGVYGGGSGSAADVSGDTELRISGGRILGSVYGGGRGGDYLLGDYADVGGAARIFVTGGRILGSVYGGACLYGRVEGGAFLTLSGGHVSGDVTGEAAYPSAHTRVYGERRVTLSGAPLIGTAGRENGMLSPDSGEAAGGIRLDSLTGGCVRVSAPLLRAAGGFPHIVLLSGVLPAGRAVVRAEAELPLDAAPFLLLLDGAETPLAARESMLAVAGTE